MTTKISFFLSLVLINMLGNYHVNAMNNIAQSSPWVTQPQELIQELQNHYHELDNQITLQANHIAIVEQHLQSMKQTNTQLIQLLADPYHSEHKQRIIQELSKQLQSKLQRAERLLNQGQAHLMLSEGIKYKQAILDQKNQSILTKLNDSYQYPKQEDRKAMIEQLLQNMKQTNAQLIQLLSNSHDCEYK